MDPLFEAMYRFKRQQFDECTRLCSTVLEKKTRDQV